MGVSTVYKRARDPKEREAQALAHDLNERLVWDAPGAKLRPVPASAAVTLAKALVDAGASRTDALEEIWTHLQKVRSAMDNGTYRADRADKGSWSVAWLLNPTVYEMDRHMLANPTNTRRPEGTDYDAGRARLGDGGLLD